MQIVFAGKAHPQDTEGKELIRKIIHFARQSDVRNNVVFLEDYDINVARYFVQGVDVWLNTPVRPMEASGTSGMKAAANGVPNLSILDGWWAEGYSPAGRLDARRARGAPGPRGARPGGQRGALQHARARGGAALLRARPHGRPAPVGPR